jgi:hypothetical protein
MPEGSAMPHYFVSDSEHWDVFSEQVLAQYHVDAAATRERHTKEYQQRKLRKAEHPESAYAGSKPFDMTKFVAAITCTNVWGTRTMQGYLRRGEGKTIAFITHRHLVRGGEVCDGGIELHRQVAKEGGLVITIKFKDVDYGVEVKKITSSGDKLCLLFESPQLGGELLTPRFAKPKPNEPIMAMYYDSSWFTLVGSVGKVFDNGCFQTKYSTKAGCCRMVVCNARGEIVGGHFFARIDAEQDAPGAMPEDGVIPKKFEMEYAVPPMIPQGEDEYDLGKAGPFQRIDPYKIYPLRTDVDVAVSTPYVLMKPSTEMLHKEVVRFFEPVEWAPDPKCWAVARKATCAYEGDAGLPFEMPSLEEFELLALAMDSGRIMAGSSDLGATHHDYFLQVGGGDSAAGARLVAADVWGFATRFGTDEQTEADALLLESMRIWAVQGKRDGYKFKKLDVGRSIQAPNVELKLLWKALFAESDTHWIMRDWSVRAGYNFDRAVPRHLYDQYVKAKGAIGLDETAFDRRVMPEMAEFFFGEYMPFLNPGVPQRLLGAIYDVTTNSVLLCTDGRAFIKKRGNPSGFPNTLRYNCVVQTLVWCYAIALRLQNMGQPCEATDVVRFLDEDCFMEVCGDDSRLNALTELAVDVLDLRNDGCAILQVWRDHLPWEVKVEGCVLFGPSMDLVTRMNAYPPLISRKLVVVDGLLWSPLYNHSRTVRRLVHDDNRNQEEEEELRTSAYATLSLAVYWHIKGKAYSPAIEWMNAQGWLTEERLKMVMSLVTRYYRDGLLCQPRGE